MASGLSIDNRSGSFADVYVTTLPRFPLWSSDDHCSRKMDIENEHLPPALVDPNDAYGHDGYGSSSDGYARRRGIPEFPVPEPYSGSGEAPAPGMPVPVPAASPELVGRKPSLGTTMTSSPSMRRRSVENTMALIRDTVDGKKDDDDDMSKLADQLARTWVHTPTGSRPQR